MARIGFSEQNLTACAKNLLKMSEIGQMVIVSSVSCAYWPVGTRKCASGVNDLELLKWKEVPLPETPFTF